MWAHACLWPVQISLTGQDTSIYTPHRPPMDTAVTLFKILTSSLHRCHLYAHNKSCDLKHWSLQNQFHFLDPRQDVRSSRLSVYLHWGRQGLTYGGYTPEQSPFSWELRLLERKEQGAIDSSLSLLGTSQCPQKLKTLKSTQPLPWTISICHLHERDLWLHSVLYPQRHTLYVALPIPSSAFLCALCCSRTPGPYIARQVL